MSKKTRLNLEISQDFANFLDDTAEREGVTRTEMVRRAFSILKAYAQQMESGRPHLGFVSNRNKLDAEMLGILTPPHKPKQNLDEATQS